MVDETTTLIPSVEAEEEDVTTIPSEALNGDTAPAVEDPETLVEWTEYVGTIPLKVIGDHAFNKYVREQGDK